MGRKKQPFRPNALEEGEPRASRWGPAGTGMCEMADPRSLLIWKTGRPREKVPRLFSRCRYRERAARAVLRW